MPIGHDEPAPIEHALSRTGAGSLALALQPGKLTRELVARRYAPRSPWISRIRRDRAASSGAEAARWSGHCQPTFARISVAISSATRLCHAGVPCPLQAVTSSQVNGFARNAYSL